MAFNLVLIMHCKIPSSCGSNLLKDRSIHSLIGENCKFWEKEEEEEKFLALLKMLTALGSVFSRVSCDLKSYRSTSFSIYRQSNLPTSHVHVL